MSMQGEAEEKKRCCSRGKVSANSVTGLVCQDATIPGAIWQALHRYIQSYIDRYIHTYSTCIHTYIYIQHIYIQYILWRYFVALSN